MSPGHHLDPPVKTRTGRTFREEHWRPVLASRTPPPAVVGLHIDLSAWPVTRGGRVMMVMAMVMVVVQL